MWFNATVSIPVWGVLSLIVFGALFTVVVVLLLQRRDWPLDGSVRPVDTVLAPKKASEATLRARAEEKALVESGQLPVLFARYEYFLRDGRGPFTFRDAQSALGISEDKQKRQFRNLPAAWKGQIIRKERLSGG